MAKTIQLQQRDEHYGILRKIGVEKQLLRYIQELSELQIEITSMATSYGSKMDLAEEVADSLIVIEGIITNYNLWEYVSMFKKQKMERLKLCYIEGNEE